MKRAVRIPEADLRAIRPLVVPVTAEPGESLAGLVVKSTRKNVLRHPRIILSEVGLDVLGTGNIGTEIGGLEARLAEKIGCTAEDIVKRSTPFVAGSSGTEVLFGDGDILRFHLDLRHRWVSPATLSVRKVHLSAWTCRLLPFCPHSLERLICRCMACGETLRWVSAWGIDVCEHCMEPARHPDGELVPARFVDGYRAFARLISADPAERATARAALGPEINQLPQPVVINLIIGLGRNVRDARINDIAPVLMTKPQLLVDVLSLGTELIHDFPRRLRSAVITEIERIGWEKEGPLRPLLQGVRSVASNSTRPEQRHIMRDALPEVFETAARALGGLRAPVMVFKDVSRQSNLDSAQMKRITDAKALKFSMAGTGLRPKLQFDKASTLDFINRLKGSEPSSYVELKLGVPRYGVEQLICMGEVREETHPAISIVYPGLRIAAAKQFIEKVEAAARTDEAPDAAISLGRAARRIGARCKPWGAIIQAMRLGHLKFWLVGEPIIKGRFVALTKRARMLPNAIAAFDEVHFEEAEHPSFAFADEISQLDACDILNLDSAQVKRISELGALGFSTTAKNRLNVCRTRVLDLASQMVGPAEISLRSGIHPNSIRRHMAANADVEPLHCGRKRKDVLREMPGRGSLPKDLL